MVTLSALLLVVLLGQFSVGDAGELRLVVVDAAGGPLPAHVMVDSDANQVSRAVDADSSGTALVPRLPFGRYRVRVTLDGFAPAEEVVEVRSAVAVEHRMTLPLAIVSAPVDVRGGSTLLDPHQTMTIRRIGTEQLRRRATAGPGRGLPDLINDQPGWLLEAGGTLHPRGSENQAQYVVDGLPLTDNRSPGFAPEIDINTVHSIGVITGGYPAEYGRKLGGVIEVATAGAQQRGFHGEAVLSLGQDATRAAAVSGGYTGGGGGIFAAGSFSSTDRYLDPPVEENFTNHGESWQGSVRAERAGLGMILSRAGTRFLVPNDPIQEEAGQRQRRGNLETAGKLSYQRVISPRSVIFANAMVRDLDATLTSNGLATPIYAAQDRGLRDGYFKMAAAGSAGRHEWKIGGDTTVGRLNEWFAYRITDEDAFEPGITPSFAFDGQARNREHALFAQDRIQAGDVTVRGGLRWDWYRLLTTESAFSPRVAAVWSPRPGLALRASYDRAFQTPASENLLLASSAEVEALAPSVVRLPVRPSRGHFYEIAATGLVAGALRLDGSWFLRRASNFADDDLLLNSGVSFPIAFRSGTVKGAEARLDVGEGGPVTGFVSYGWMRGTAELPVAGGLFLGDEISLGHAGEIITISQDQRHTLRARVAARLRSGGWLALAVATDSGLPFEEEGEGNGEQEIPKRILDRVDLEAGRIRPTTVLDLTTGWRLKRAGPAEFHLQAGVRNLTGTLRVINFAGVLSGTALAAPRTFSIRVRAGF